MNPSPLVDMVQIQTIIKVKVLPKSYKNLIIGKEGNVFKVKLASPPVDGKANKALIRLFADILGISKGRIKIISGKRSRLKSICISGLSLEDITSILEK